MIAELFQFAASIIDYLGYVGIFILMALESCAVPIPSEVVVPLAGYLATKGVFGIAEVIFVTTLANLVGSMALYYLGMRGRGFVLKYGKFIGIRRKHLSKVERWFKERGEVTVFIGRVLPAVRTYISLPAGISKMKIEKFAFYTFLGSFIWNSMLTYAGVWLGLNWFKVEKYLDLVGLAIAAAFVAYIWKKIK